MTHVPALYLMLAAMTQSAGTEVRQIVTFKFQPGRSAEATKVFRERALPLYEDNAPMLRFRGYREAESPEPLDLMVVSSFDGMEGMDASNRALRETAEKHGTSVGKIYGEIGALSQSHRDEFVEIYETLSWGSRDGAALTAWMSFQIAPGATSRFEKLLRETILPWEKDLDIDLSGSESGPYLVSSGWDYVRVIRVGSLGDFHAYLREIRAQPWAQELDLLVTRSRQMLLVPIPELSVR